MDSPCPYCNSPRGLGVVCAGPGVCLGNLCHNQHVPCPRCVPLLDEKVERLRAMFPPESAPSEAEARHMLNPIDYGPADEGGRDG